jgi:hypothetical protein
MPRGREAAHVDDDLGDDDLSPQITLLGKGAQPHDSPHFRLGAYLRGRVRDSG